jgi:type VI secretion system protein ImpM
MPGPVLTAAPGFWGKLPAAGDFVGRRLSAPFVRPWDRWLTRHLLPRLGRLDRLCFHLGPQAGGPMTGIVLPSRDRAGRPFPLTLAAPLPGPADPAWYAALATLGRAALGGLDAPALDARLLALPPAPAATPNPARLLLWTPGASPLEADPDAPGPALDALLGIVATEAG